MPWRTWQTTWFLKSSRLPFLICLVPYFYYIGLSPTFQEVFTVNRFSVDTVCASSTHNAILQQNHFFIHPSYQRQLKKWHIHVILSYSSSNEKLYVRFLYVKKKEKRGNVGWVEYLSSVPLRRMAEDGQIKKSVRGKYCAFSTSSPSSEQVGYVPSGTSVASVSSNHSICKLYSRQMARPYKKTREDLIRLLLLY
jgi:hypothetical protein